MDRALEEGGVEPENRARAGKIVDAAKRALGFKSFAVANVAEGPDFLVKLYDPSAGSISARGALSLFARECGGVREATVRFPRSGLDAPLELHVSVLKAGRRGIERYSAPRAEKIYLDDRLREKAGDVRMPRALAVALGGVASDVIAYCKPELNMRLTYWTGERRCVATFCGARECSLSFLEHLFERYGRRLVDVELRSAGLERQLIARLDADAELPPFPRRGEEREASEANKRARLDG